MFQQALDFREECDTLDQLLGSLAEGDFERETLFKSWTINDILGHLHMWNWAADLAIQDPEGFTKFRESVVGPISRGASITEIEREWRRGSKGTALLGEWRRFYGEMCGRLEGVDPKKRTAWIGPDMSVRSSVTARQMETWAHGQAIYDLLGLQRVDTDRIRNVAEIGVRTFGWTFANRGLDVPTDVPQVRLVAPSGTTWTWGEAKENERIEGDATEFCQVVAQTRNVADTRLRVSGPAARRWMSLAQCFAGPPVDPPPPGTRYCAVRGAPQATQ